MTCVQTFREFHEKEINDTGPMAPMACIKEAFCVVHPRVAPALSRAKQIPDGLAVDDMMMLQ